MGAVHKSRDCVKVWARRISAIVAQRAVEAPQLSLTALALAPAHRQIGSLGHGRNDGAHASTP